MTKTIDNQVEKSTRLIMALKANISEFENKGVNMAELDKMTKDLKRLEESSNTAEELRKKLSDQVKNTNNILAQCKEDFARTKAVVRNNYPQEEWIKYGVADKR